MSKVKNYPPNNQANHYICCKHRKNVPRNNFIENRPEDLMRHTTLSHNNMLHSNYIFDEGKVFSEYESKHKECARVVQGDNKHSIVFAKVLCSIYLLPNCIALRDR